MHDLFCPSVSNFVGIRCELLISVTFILDPDEPPTRDVTSPSKSGVAYLTENLIRRLTKQENVVLITSLHVTLGKELNKKIKVNNSKDLS